jgi:cellulose synthase/poly-beta-1,6-N-acetylglucosamine synthase-like glycosyltransferase
MPKSVSVVVPVKASERTIAQTVGALLSQHHDGLLEIILVGDRDDTTWQPIRREIEAGLVRIVEVDVATGGRDANHKRNAGLAAAAGDVLCLTDSDMMPGPDWIATGAGLVEAGWSCVAGPMTSAEHGFWSEYVDENALASKTPRMTSEYVAGATAGGRRGSKLPITANVFFSRALFERVGGLDPEFVYSYEDYEWFQRVVDAGYEILCTPRLVAHHHHRQGWRALVREYRLAGRGCAQFVHRHRSSRLSRQRLRQLAAVVSACVLGTAAATALTAGWVRFTPAGALALAAVTGCALLLSVSSAFRVHRLSGLAYPLVSLVLGLAFSAGMLAGLPPRRR